MDLREQLEAAEKSVLVVPQPWLGVLDVTGGDRQTWLNGLVTCDLAKLKEGEGAYGLAVGKNGRILADLFALVAADHLYVVAPRTTLEPLAASFEHYLVMEDVEVRPAEGDFSIFVAHGPAAEAVVSVAASQGAPAAVVDVSGAPLGVVLVPKSQEEAVTAALALAARSAGGVIGDDLGWDALRLARFVPRFGVDFDEKTYPQEASLEKRAVSFSKGCYLGQEVVCMLEMRGHVKRKLALLAIDGEDAPARGAKVSDAAGTEQGEITSATWVPTLGATRAIAMVKRAAAEVGTELRVESRVARVVAE